MSQTSDHDTVPTPSRSITPAHGMLPRAPRSPWARVVENVILYGFLAVCVLAVVGGLVFANVLSTLGPKDIESCVTACGSVGVQQVDSHVCVCR